ncbi:nucleotidyltransferase-like protein [Alteribacillus bidgolensis]|uniref:Nucleotidyltransferase-like n=1 Tax=Alteribacillus bidgolensis TaxID=930129 RepID=A0A1G8LEB8_9BACI|nr:nucleotidyltransferase-like protein [Alteribacillus bidgolensis]SDI54005.1 Nucleotidyltransferase-like [Alteribacillus bidgolensis]
MEGLLRHLYQERASDPLTKGVLLVEKVFGQEPFTDFFDAVIIIICEETSAAKVKHYNCSGIEAALHVVTEDELFYWILSGTNRKMIDWLFRGKILFNKNEYITNLKLRLSEFPAEDRLRKTGNEFAKLIRRFEDGKALFHLHHYLDAFNHILHALHHLARLSIIEEGLYPEVTLWRQVREVDPETYKLYHELIVGDEGIEKRLELLMIAIEFAIRSKIHIGKAHLASIMEKKNDGKNDGWSYTELAKSPEVNDYVIDLEILLQYLVENGQVKKVKEPSKTSGVFHYKYVL